MRGYSYSLIQETGFPRSYAKTSDSRQSALSPGPECRHHQLLSSASVSSSASTAFSSSSSPDDRNSRRSPWKDPTYREWHLDQTVSRGGCVLRDAPKKKRFFWRRTPSSSSSQVSVLLRDVLQFCESVVRRQFARASLNLTLKNSSRNWKKERGSWKASITHLFVVFRTLLLQDLSANRRIGHRSTTLQVQRRQV